MLADGGDTLCDLAALRDQEVRFGPVATDAPRRAQGVDFIVAQDISIAVVAVAAHHITLDEEHLAKVREARAKARRRGWKLAEPQSSHPRHRRHPGHGALREKGSGGHL